MEAPDPIAAMTPVCSHSNKISREWASSEAEYPHETHDRNALSHYFLETTVLEKDVIMGSTNYMRRTSKTISESYAAIAEYNKSLTPLLFTRMPLANKGAIDYDRIGILFQHREYYYIIFEADAAKDAATATCVQRGFVHKSRVGRPLILEWESIPKVPFGHSCFGASSSTKGWWHVHAAKVARLRDACCLEAHELGSKRHAKTKLPPSEKQFVVVLTHQFGRIVDAYFGTLAVQKKQMLEQMESVWDEFMVPDVCEGKSD